MAVSKNREAFKAWAFVAFLVVMEITRGVLKHFFG